jgi:uncharacterized protein YndB with AHSA1/START domain
MKWALVLLVVIAVVIAAVAIIGALLPKGHVAASSAEYNQTPEAIWETITDAKSFATWRPDLKEVQVLPDRNGLPVWREIGKSDTMTLEVIESSPPNRLVMRIADPDLPFGGTWTYEVTGANGRASLRITENGEVYNVFFRFMSRFIFGHHSTIETYLKSLGKKFGEETTPVRIS